MTVAFVFCAFLTYLLWWHKPFDIERKNVIMCRTSQALGDDEGLVVQDGPYWKLAMS